MPGVDRLMAMSNPGWGRHGAYSGWGGFGRYNPPRRKRRVVKKRVAARKVAKRNGYGVLRRVRTPTGVRYQRGGKFISTAAAEKIIRRVKPSSGSATTTKSTKGRKNTRRNTRRNPKMAKSAVRRAPRRKVRANRALTKRQKAARKAVRTKRRLGLLPSRRTRKLRGYRKALRRAGKRAWRKPPYKPPAKRRRVAAKRLRRWHAGPGRRWKRKARNMAFGYRRAGKRKGLLTKRGKWRKGARLHPPVRRRRRKSRAKGQWVSSIRTLESGLVPVRANRRRRRKSRRNAYIQVAQPTRINRRRRRRNRAATAPVRRRRRRTRVASPVRRRRSRRNSARRNVRRNPRRNRAIRRYGARRNFAGTVKGLVIPGLIGAVSLGAARALSGFVGGFVAGKLPASTPQFVRDNFGVVVSGLSLALGHFATKRGPLAKHRNVILGGLALNVGWTVLQAVISKAFATTDTSKGLGKALASSGLLTPGGAAHGVGDLYYGDVDNPYRYLTGMGGMGNLGRYVEAPMGQLYEAPAGMGAYIQTQGPEAIGELYQAPAGLGSGWVEEARGHMMQGGAPGLPEAGSVNFTGRPTGVFSESIFGTTPSTAQ